LDDKSAVCGENSVGSTDVVGFSEEVMCMSLLHFSVVTVQPIFCVLLTQKKIHTSGKLLAE
jgi:hypothetical protein